MNIESIKLLFRKQGRKEKGKAAGRKGLAVKKPDIWERFYPQAEKIVDFTDRLRTAESKEKELQQFQELYITADSTERGRAERVKQIAIAMVFLLVTVILAAVVELKGLATGITIRDNCIQRHADTQELTLNWVTEEENGSISVSLSPQRIPLTERDALFEEAEAYIRSCIQGGNESLLAIRGDVFFPETVPGTEMTVVCRPGSYRWLNADGSRTMHELPKEGTSELLYITMRYYEEERELVLELLLFPEGSERELFQKQVKDELLVRAADNTGTSLVLPEEIGGVPVEWSVKREHNGVTLLFLGLVAAVCIPVAGKRKQEEALRKREQELIADYPELVSKYLLLLNAGLSPRSVWERLVADYRKSGRQRFVYDEMLLTLREMENGIPEVRAYERFGKRCKLLPYMRFSGVLVQNLQKGAKGALHLLEQEAMTAFAERKEAAKRKGEEAGTKLLLPMFGLLGIVLVIVMIPAFWKL